MNNEETDLQTQTVASMAVSNSKNDFDILYNKKYVFPNMSYANILKQNSGMRRPSNLLAYVSTSTNNNQGYNILRLFDTLPSILFTTSEMKLNY